MKLRIKGNSIRLRLTQSEVAAFAESGTISERLQFAAGHALAYRLRSDSRLEQLAASFAGQELTVRVPEAEVAHWLSPSQISMVGTQQLPDGETLSLLVEKDFACLVDRPGEDDSDAFAHPADEKSKALDE